MSKPAKFNTEFYKTSSGKTFARITGKAASFAICYFVKNISNPEFVPRLEVALEAIFGVASDKMGTEASNTVREILGRGGHKTVQSESLAGESIIHDAKDDHVEKLQTAVGFGEESKFAEYVQNSKTKLITSSTNAELRTDVTACAVALGLAIGIEKIRSGFEIFFMFQRLLSYYAFRNRESMEMTFGDMVELTHLDYEAVLAEIKSEESIEGTRETVMTSFAFEDLTDIFADGHLDAQVMKDSELQAYKVEAEFVYSDVSWKDDRFCEDVSVPVLNEYNQITGYKNIGPVDYPCIDESYNIAPITGSMLSRTTVEAPPVYGEYSSEAKEYIEKRLRENYPFGALYGDNWSYENAESFKHADGTWLTAWYIGSQVQHTVTDGSHFESYSYVNDHETRDGRPWTNDLRYGSCYNSQGNYLYGMGGTGPEAMDFCLTWPGQCWPHNISSLEDCEAAGGYWARGAYHGYNEEPGDEEDGHCDFGTENSCLNGGGVWSPYSWAWDDPYEIPAPFAFPYGAQRDMSLRHHIIKEDVGSAAYWWDDATIIERTGFTLAPIEFHPARLSGLYKDYKVNPVIDFTNVGRRAFAATVPTVGVIGGTVGPPQPAYLRYDAFVQGGNLAWPNDYEGGPFAHVQIESENKTNRQNASITVTPGWMWKFQYNSTLPPVHTMETGGWNIPMSQKYTYPGFSEAVNGGMDLIFESKSISNFWDKPFLNTPGTNNAGETTGNEVHPSIYNSDRTLRPEEGYHNQKLTANRFFGMGDGSQDYEISGWNRENAGYKWTFYSVPTGNIDPKRLYETSPGASSEYEINQNTLLSDVLAVSGAEILYSETILGVSGPSFWNEFITGYIYTGQEYAGKIVSCMHEWTGYSTTSSKTLKYWWVDPNPPSYFPFSGIDLGWHTSRFLASIPNVSRCRTLFGTTTTTTPAPTTTSAPTTTTTCDPMDPGCGQPTSTTTTTTEDPMMEACDNPKTAKCSFDCDQGSPGSDLEFCNYTQCVNAMCANGVWDERVTPEEWGWAPLYGKQRGENPPRYWRGPFASTRYKFMYPHASGAFAKYYESELKDPEYLSLISGFPTKIKFSVEIEEYISKDICSGGYIDAGGNVVMTHAIRNEEGLLQPVHQKETGNMSWWSLIDEKFSPQSEMATYDINNDPPKTIVLEDSTHTRNHSFYDNEVSFCAGNKIGAPDIVQYTGHGPRRATMAFGGYHRFTGYSFDIEATYAKPSFVLEKYGLDYSSIVDALAVGNEAAYICGLYKDGEGLDTYDPVYFLPMVSDDGTTGSYIENRYDPTGENYVTGSLVHKHNIYGDHWMGLRSGCIFEVSGGHDYYLTGFEPMDPEFAANCENVMESEKFYWLEEACDDAASELGMSPGSDTYPQFAQDKVFLFNLSDSGIHMHFRRPVYLDGFEMPDPMVMEMYDLGPPTPYGYGGLDYNGCSIWSRPHSISITGAGPSGDKQIELFKKDNDFNIIFSKEVVRNEGLLFDIDDTTTEWSCIENEGGYDYEEITGHGKRLARGWPATGCAGMNIFNPPGETTTTTCDPSDPECGEKELPTTYIRVSGWREISTIKVTLKNFEPYYDTPGELPNDSEFKFMQSGNCSLTGYLSYQNQEEASIFTEGIVLKDISDDPWFHLIDYPHYASDVLKRGDIVMPNDDVHGVDSAPSKMLTRWNVNVIDGTTVSGGYMMPLKSDGPENYNKFLWPTMSDVAHYNGSHLSWESIPPDDGHTYLNSYLMICGEAGQPTDVGSHGDHITKRYLITQHWGIYDSVLVDPMLNPKYKMKLSKPIGNIGDTITPKGGYVVPVGTTCWDIKQGLVSGKKQGVDGYKEEGN